MNIVSVPLLECACGREEWGAAWHMVGDTGLWVYHMAIAEGAGIKRIPVEILVGVERYDIGSIGSPKRDDFHDTCSGYWWNSDEVY